MALHFEQIVARVLIGVSRHVLHTTLLTGGAGAAEEAECGNGWLALSVACGTASAMVAGCDRIAEVRIAVRTDEDDVNALSAPPAAEVDGVTRTLDR
jgi:hypothetical protein